MRGKPTAHAVQYNAANNGKQRNRSVPKQPRVATAPIVGDIVEKIGLEIIEGRLSSGSDLNSVALAKRFGTSRTPIREALMQLAEKGLVSIEPRRRPQVARLSVKAIRELYGIRRALHAYLSQAIVQHASDEELRELDACAHRLAEETRRLDDLHRVIVETEKYMAAELALCGNDLLIDVFDALAWRIQRMRRFSAVDIDLLRRLSTDRCRVTQAYRERNAVLAAALNDSMLAAVAQLAEANFNASMAKHGSV
ncbi:GntR family transcriptional regulator [Candidimonas nitroreducens]|uniref:GntR family transcriptional regulator n=1 Tax=Candidimonas nitroreducens TaxID=683354 RepID=UPI001302F27B|nr:GntR family transcriptional regulator [Candidimonas nitroreducens]